MGVFLRGVLHTVDEEGERGDSGGRALGAEGFAGTLKDGAVVACRSRWDGGKQEGGKMGKKYVIFCFLVRALLSNCCAATIVRAREVKLYKLTLH